MLDRGEDHACRADEHERDADDARYIVVSLRFGSQPSLLRGEEAQEWCMPQPTPGGWQRRDRRSVTEWSLTGTDNATWPPDGRRQRRRRPEDSLPRRRIDTRQPRRHASRRGSVAQARTVTTTDGEPANAQAHS